MKWNNLNGQFYEGDQIETLTFYYEILVDSTSVEIYADHGKFCLIAPLVEAKNDEGFVFGKSRGLLKFDEIEVYELKSIWKNNR